MNKYYDTGKQEIEIRFESGTHPLTIGQDLIQSILDLSNDYWFSTAILSVEHSYVVELVYRMESIKLYWLVVSQRWSETYYAA